jgi:ABC-type lipoprotein release transport system permease subunit
VLEVSWAAIAAIGSLIIALGVIAGFWSKFSDRLTNAETAADTAKTLAIALQLKVDNIQKELSDYRVEAAGKFVSGHDLNQAEDRFRSLVDEIKKDIRGVTERLDRVLADK